MAGRRPLPKALKLVRGNPGGRAIRDDEPEPVAGWPDKPAKLPKVASDEWDRLAHLLDKEQRLSQADGPWLTGAAVAWDAIQQIRRRLSGRGLPVDVWLRLKTGERLQWEAYRKFCNDLCLSQGTRARASKVGGRGKVTSKIEEFHASRSKR